MPAKSNRWQRDRIVIGIFWTSVVAKMNLTCGGGSSSVFSRALNAAVREHVDFVDDVDLVPGPLRAGSRRCCGWSRTSSTPRLLAPSISSTSTSSPAAMAWQMSHWSHGVGRRPLHAVERLGEDAGGATSCRRRGRR